MSYDSTIPLLQGATKASEIALDRAEHVTNTPVGASLITSLEQLQLLSADGIRRNNSIALSDGEVFWDGASLNFNSLQQGSNITYRLLQMEAPASAYVDMIMVGSVSSLATSTIGVTALTGISAVAQLLVGAYVFSPNLSPGTFITQITSSTPGNWAVVLNQPALFTNNPGDMFIFAQPVPFPLTGTVNGSDNTMVGIPTTVGLFAGQPVFGTGIPLGSTIATLTGPNSITLSQVTTAPFTGTFTGYQIVPQTAAFGAVPINNGDLAYLELDRSALLSQTAATAQFIIENGINGGSTNTGHRLVKINLTPTQAMPELQLPVAGSGPGAVNTFALSLATRRDFSNSQGSFTPLYWAPHGIRWDANTVSFVGQLPAATAGLPTGMLMDYAGGVAPSGWLIADGSAVSRSTYLNLFNALSVNILGDLNNTTLIDNVSSLANIQVGDFLSGPGIQAGTTVISFAVVLGDNQITMSLPSTIPGVGVAIVDAAWGIGDGSTTFNLPDSRGRAAIGSGAGVGLTARTRGASLGEEAHLLLVAESGLVGHTHVDSGHTHATNATTKGTTDAAPGVARTEVNGPATNSTGFANIQAVASADAASSHNNMQPSFVATKLIKY